MKNRSLALILLITFSHALFAIEAPLNEALDAYIENCLPHCGTLKSSNGFTYVDIDDNYIHALLPFLKEEGYQAPPYFEPPYGVGAHISVNLAKEAPIPACNEIIYFTPKERIIVPPLKWKEVEQFYLLTVDAPQLTALREKHGLPPMPYDFHITIALKPKPGALLQLPASLK